MPVIISWLIVFVMGVSAAAQDPPSPAASGEGRDRGETLARGIAEKVAAHRGLAWKEKVRIGTYQVAELRAFLTRALEKEWPAQRLEGYGRALKAFGLIPADYDLRAGLLGVLTEQVAGFYDPDSKELRLIDRRRAEAAEGDGAKVADEDRIIMAHELVHALQDQHFDLKSLPLDVEDDDDLAIAASALVEGDATLAMMGVELGGRSTADLFRQGRLIAASLKLVGGAALAFMPGMQQFKAAPAVLQQSLLFPYEEGLSFCLKAGADGREYRGIDAAFAAPPLSTEQVLHPAKLLGPERDDPQVLTLPDLAPRLGPGAVRTHENTLGELRTAVLLDAALTRRGAAKAAAGWGGDRYALYTRPGARDCLVWATTWDDDDEATEFETAVIAWLRKRRAEDATPVDWAPLLIERDGGLADVVARRGPDVALVLDGPRTELAVIVRAVFEDTGRSRRTALPRAGVPR